MIAVACFGVTIFGWHYFLFAINVPTVHSKRWLIHKIGKYSMPHFMYEYEQRVEL